MSTAITESSRGAIVLTRHNFGSGGDYLGGFGVPSPAEFNRGIFADISIQGGLGEVKFNHALITSGDITTGSGTGLDVSGSLQCRSLTVRDHSDHPPADGPDAHPQANAHPHTRTHRHGVRVSGNVTTEEDCSVAGDALASGRFECGGSLEVGGSLIADSFGASGGISIARGAAVWESADAFSDLPHLAITKNY